jgi:hypothetical protein
MEINGYEVIQEHAESKECLFGANGSRGSC